ncbi:hypothetical protein N0V90_002826 [Kalmusia sp. IMI 367209]|nr:hypothetical protein N0V90_002826 [Kalmusia sp. IMI 367209]
MQLLDLPLVLVQDIIEIVVLSQPFLSDWSTIHDLRLVNRLFEREVTKFWARHSLCESRKRIRSDEPLNFTVRLLQEHVGAQDRNECELASKMHAAVDLLVAEFQSCGLHKARSEILRDACEAAIRDGFYRQVRHYRPCIPPQEGKRFDFKPCHVLDTALLTATIMQYTSVFTALIDPTRYCDDAVEAHFARSLYQAIRFGHANFVRIFFDKGVQLEHVIDLHKALTDAMKGEHDQQKVRNNVQNASTLIEVAAHYHGWDIVRKLLAWHGSALSEERLKSVLCWASADGINDVIIEIIKFGVLPRSERSLGCYRLPLREAVRGGSIDTVQLLLDNGAMGDEIECHVDVLARHVAISGNFALFELLKKYYFWKSSTEYNFLPIAAEHGHMEFARYAIESGLKERKMSACEVVRWLVLEVGLSLTEKQWDDGSPLTTMAFVFAVDAGNSEMVRLLMLESGGMSPSEETWAAFGYPSQDTWAWNTSRKREARCTELDRWRKLLRLGNDFSADYTNANWSTVKDAYSVARNFMGTKERSGQE